MNKKDFDMVGVRLVPERKLYSEKEIVCSEDAVALLSKELGEHDREVFCVLHLSPKGIPLSASITSIGELTSTLVHPREVFKSAVLSSAAGVILLHNHPSGNTTPSEEDIKTTERIAVCGRVLGIPVVDHIICAEHGYISMRSYGYEHLFNDSENDLNKIRECEAPEIRLSEDKDGDFSSIKIFRKINGKETEIPLTRYELSEAYFEQQRIWDESYVRNYLSDIGADKERRLEFKAENGVSVNSLLKSDKIILCIAADMRRKVDKYGMSDYDALEETIKEEARKKSCCRQKEEHVR
ncbi:MAG: JAB domain-containing protein [Anaerovoracaceae bacterium]